MTEQQYRQLLQNRRRPAAQLLSAGATVEKLLRSASRSVRRRNQAQKALEAVLPAQLLVPTRVDGLEGGTLSLVVSDPVGCEQLRRQGPRLQRQLAQHVPGLRQVRVSLAREGTDSASRACPEGEGN